MGYKVNKIRLGTQQVRPSIFKKSIDLRGKTLSQIQAEGWNISAYSGGYTLNNNGLKNDVTPKGNNVVFLYYHLPQSLTSSNKIKIHLTGYRTRYVTDYVGWQDIGLTNTIANSGINFVGGCYNAGQYGDNTGINYYYNNVLTTLSSVGPNSPGGDTDLTWELDLSNGNITFNITSPTTRTGTGTLSSSQLSYVLGLNYIYVRTTQLHYGSGDYGLIKTVDFTIS